MALVVLSAPHREQQRARTDGDGTTNPEITFLLLAFIKKRSRCLFALTDRRSRLVLVRTGTPPDGKGKHLPQEKKKVLGYQSYQNLLVWSFRILNTHTSAHIGLDADCTDVSRRWSISFSYTSAHIGRVNGGEEQETGGKHLPRLWQAEPNATKVGFFSGSPGTVFFFYWQKRTVQVRELPGCCCCRRPFCDTIPGVWPFGPGNAGLGFVRGTLGFGTHHLVMSLSGGWISATRDVH